jgi:GTP-binding protein
MDMPEAEENLATFKELLKVDVPIFPISALTRKGLRELLFAVADMIEDTPEFPLEHDQDQEEVVSGLHRVLYKHEAEPDPFTITRESDASYVVVGEKVEKLFKMTDFSREESVRRFSRQLRGLGLDKALRERGAKDGDIVKLFEFEFEFIE